MNEYFKLQYLMTKRKLSDGSSLIVGYFLALVIVLVFISLSIWLFRYKTYAPYMYIFVSLYFTTKLSEIKRNDFLKIHFGNSRYRKVRISENLIIALPFVIFLLYKHYFLPTIFLVIITVVMALFSFKTTYHLTIPTPFSKKPFEFTVGFRNSFFVFFITYGLAIIAVTVDNFNLGVFALLLIFLTVLGYYLKPENEYFVWSYSLTPSKFLIEKVKTAFVFSSCLCSPVLILLGIFYFENLDILLLCMLLGNLYLITMILAKYSAYPSEIDLARVMIMVICLIFPPMLIAMIPFFANQSVNKLKLFLE